MRNSYAKKCDLDESKVLYELMTYPDVFLFVCQKADSHEKFLFMTKQTAWGINFSHYS
jgi:hypothetical protein